MADALIIFGAALLGALVGGAASAVGSWAVTRWEHVREMRAEVYRHLLPEVINIRTGKLRYANPDNYDPILNAARTGRREDRRWADRIETDLEAFTHADRRKQDTGTFNQDTGDYDYPDDLAAAATHAHADLTTTLRGYVNWLEDQLG